MDWETAVKLPWGILLLFGGAFAVAYGFEASGLAEWLAHQLEGLKDIPLFLLLFLVTSWMCAQVETFAHQLQWVFDEDTVDVVVWRRVFENFCHGH